MRKLIILFVALAVLMLSSVFVNAEAGAITSANITATNLTEYNDDTPPIQVRVEGNASSYFVNLTLSDGTVVASNQEVTNATDTNVSIDAQPVSATIVIYPTFLNSTAAADAETEENGTSYVFEINQQPVIINFPNVATLVGQRGSVTFSVDYNDTNSTGDDMVDFFVCSSDSFTGGACDATQLCTATGISTNTSSCAYSIPVGSTAGTKTAYGFLYDDNTYASTSLPATYKVSGAATVEDFERYYAGGALINEQPGGAATGTNNPAGGGTNTTTWIVGIIVISILVWLWRKSQ